VLDHLEAGSTDDFSHVTVSHSREYEDSAKRGNKISVLGTTRTHGPDLIGDCGVEDGQVAGDTTLNELFEDNIRSSDPHLWAARTCVVDLDGDARARNGFSAELKARQRVTGDVNINGLFDCLNKFFIFVNLVDDGTAAKHERKSQQRGCG
jgi:hypothetical protein